MSKPTRDMDELEGSLLPTAELVAPNAPKDDQTIEVAATVPAAYFAGQSQTATAGAAAAGASEVHYAPVIPQPYGGNPLHNSARDAGLLKEGEQKGRIFNAVERSDVRRNAREINAIDYHQQQNISEANQRARQIQGNEDAGFVQTTMVMEPPQEGGIPERKEPEFYPGTYGKGYETSNYQVGEYETSDCKVTEYKSVYDS